jgi:predicted Fe-Mo cluster-binding NifX family protein
MKIAAVTGDGLTIHSHFGQAPYFQVLTLEQGKIVGREQRVKPFHSGHHQQPHTDHYHAGRDSQADRMAEVIADCDVLLARGMGEPAYLTLKAAGVEPLLVQERTIEEAVQAYLRGELQHHAERVHAH